MNIRRMIHAYFDTPGSCHPTQFSEPETADYYADLDTLCDDLELDKHTLEETLQSIDYTYDPAVNQFI